IERPACRVSQGIVLRHADIAEQIFEAGVLDKGIGFEIQEDVSQAGFRQAGESAFGLESEQFMKRLARGATVQLKSSLLADLGIALDGAPFRSPVARPGQ